jgi:predicted heme/steroid binding protein
MKEYTREELAQCTGEDGQPALLCCHGLVYDVSNSYHWRRGRHHALHRAGVDLTEELKKAPHGPHLLERVPMVGRLQQG